jgi:hypothetical protein
MSGLNETSDLDLGYVVTGVLQRHPTENTWVLLVKNEQGVPGYFSLEEVFKKYAEQEIRLTVATQATLQHLTALVAGEDPNPS